MGMLTATKRVRFAIGFGPSLFQPDRNELYEEANRNLHIGRVIYGAMDAGARHRRAIAKAAEQNKTDRILV
jgi:hypothetical protein